ARPRHRRCRLSHQFWRGPQRAEVTAAKVPCVAASPRVLRHRFHPQTKSQTTSQLVKIAVWDTYVTKNNGTIMHFDILVPSELKDTD
ncbi:MAG: DUF2024 family protein, partial [Limisphaerales bacterium]